MLPTQPPCSHPPLPVHVVGIPFKTGVAQPRTRRPYVTVIAQVDSSGRVVDARIDDSSGNDAYDAAGLASMKQSTFMPASVDCKPVAGTAEYVVSTGNTTFADPCEHDAIVLTQVQPDYPDSARRMPPVEHTVSVSAQLDPVGRLMKLEVTQSSNIAALDASAYQAAKFSSYFPAVHGCMPAAGSYQFRVTFSPGI